MNIDDLKKQYKTVGMPEMDISIKDFTNLEDFIQQIKKQDKDDEKYLLHNKMLPVLIGLLFITLIIILNPIKTALLVGGTLMIFLGLFFTFIFLLMDYKSISQESYDLSLLAYLKQKEKRLSSWRATPNRFKWSFSVFVSGLIMMITGNALKIPEISNEYILLFLVSYVGLLLICWIIGEHFYRRRHQKKHRPLLNIISELKSELETNKRDN
jgi:hypothetical protein